MENLKIDFDEQINSLKNTLLTEFKACNKVFIIPHKNMDFDALASATALADLCNYLRINNYIVTNDEPKKMKPSLSEVYYELNNKYNFINTDCFELINDNDSLFIVVDSCVTNLIPINNIESYKNTIIVIDHHKPDDKAITTDKLFINLDASSASEMLFYVLKSIDFYISKETAQLLLAGIYLDTNELYYVYNPSGFKTVTKLLQYGANLQDVQNLFTISNFEDDRKQKRLINNLVDCTKFYHDSYSRRYAITLNTDNPDTIYTHEQLAEACDSLLQYPLDAAFVVGYIDKKELGKEHVDKIAIKARSKVNDNIVDVAEIMQLFNGGGDLNRAACILSINDIFTVKDALKHIIKSDNLETNKKYIYKQLYK